MRGLTPGLGLIATFLVAVPGLRAEDAKALSPEVAERYAVVADTADWRARIYQQKDFEGAEKFVADRLANSDDVRSYELGRFYLGAGYPSKDMTGTAMEAVLSEWAKTHPNSQIPYIIRGQLLLELGWVVRGHKFADEVSDKQWRSFKEKLIDAREALERAYALNPKDPNSSAILVQVARDLDLGNEKLEAYYQRALAVDPGNYFARQHKATALQPRWGGSVQEQDALTRECLADAEKYPYSGRIVLDILEEKRNWADYQADKKGGNYLKSDEQWATAQKVYDRILVRYPGDLLILYRYAYWAFWNEKYDKAAELFEQIGDRWTNLSGWPSLADYNAARVYTYSRLASAASEKRDWPQAKLWLGKLQAYDPGSEWGKAQAAYIDGQALGPSPAVDPKAGAPRKNTARAPASSNRRRFASPRTVLLLSLLGLAWPAFRRRRELWALVWSPMGRPVALLAFGAGFYLLAPARTLWRCGVNKAARVAEFRLAATDGRIWSYAECLGRPMLYILFDTTCPHNDFEIMATFYKRFNGTQLCIVPFAADGTGLEAIKPWAAGLNLPYPVYVQYGWYPDELWYHEVPVMFLVDRKGVTHQPWPLWQGNQEKAEGWIMDQLFDGSPDAKIPGRFFSEPDALISQEEKADKEVEEQAGRLFAARAYQDLDTMAQQLRGSKERLPGGLWKLRSFYRGLADDIKVSDDQAYQARLAALGQWVQASSESVTARTVLAEVYYNYAWKARGNDYSNNWSDQARRVFEERLKKAQDLIVEADQLPTRCPEADLVRLWLGACLHWDQPRFDAAYRKAVELEPGYSPVHAARSWYLQPNWYGSDEDVVRAAEDAAQAAKDLGGMEYYARVLWNATDELDFHPDDLFSATPASWPKMRQGFLDMQKKYPQSFKNLNGFAHFACLAGDKETARSLFEQIGEHYDGREWRGGAGYLRWRRWAEATPIAGRAASR